MKDIMIIAVLACVILGISAEIAITREFTKRVSQMADTWETVPYEENLFKGWTVEELKNMMQTRKEPPVEYTKVYERESEYPNLVLPDNFDARNKWGKCIHPIRNQGHCGSCWAHGATESVSDRYCIKGKDVVLSPQDLVSCDPHDHGCHGGGDISPFIYLTNPGAVTDTCFPYVSGDGHVPPCISKCVNGEPFVKYGCKAGSVVIKGVVRTQQEELYNNGPMSTSFTVFQDFMAYKKGIYQHKTGNQLGGHAIKVLGWGVEGELKYWLCANSWGPNWGENGYFRIKVGDCDIMERGVGCTPSL